MICIHTSAYEKNTLLFFYNENEELIRSSLNSSSFRAPPVGS